MADRAFLADTGEKVGGWRVEMGAREDHIAATEHYAVRYEMVARYPFIAPRPILLADHRREDTGARRCRFWRGAPRCASC